MPNERPRLLPLTADDVEWVRQAARILVLGFAENWPDAWPTMESALEEVQEALGEDRICRVAVEPGGEVVGWAGAIRQYDGGRGADIIAFQEIENSAILDRLSFEYLEDLGYGPGILIEGEDYRGIDVAFLSRLPLTEPPLLHPIRFEDYPEREGDTRGVLQATFKLPDGSELTGFSVHFPAPFHPTAMRVAAYQQLNELRRQLPDDRYVFAAGDFNTTSTEMREQGMLERFVRPLWTAVHESCEGCPGTHYYARGDSWSFLDMILFASPRGEKTTWQIRADSVRILNGTPAQVTEDGTPNRYRSAAQTGVSDHWPLLFTIESTEKQ